MRHRRLNADGRRELRRAKRKKVTSSQRPAARPKGIVGIRP